MKIMEYYFAVDLGATSGRTIVGCVIDGRLQQRELTRFDNKLVGMCTGICIACTTKL